MNLVLEAIGWSIFATVLSQVISVALMTFLGVPPKRLAHEIEDEQNPAVGGFFFIVALITAIYVGTVSGDGYNPSDSTLEDLAWIFGGVLMATVFTWIAFEIAHTLLDRIPGESTYGYIRRELIDEKNASMAFFLGALMVAPFIATLYQII